MIDQERMECVDERPDDPCTGAIEYRYALSGSGASFPRCDRHWEERLRRQEQIDRDYPDSPVAPSWFDPEAAGESWDYE